jgi:hypothetical protein
MKPRILFGLIFGALGIPLFYYAFNAVGGECWGPVVIGILAGGAGVLTNLAEKAYNKGEAGKAGATTGAIMGLLLGMSMGVHFYSPDGTGSTISLVIMDTILFSIIFGAITTMVGALAATTASPDIFQYLIKSIIGQGKKYQSVLMAGAIAAMLTYLILPGIVSLLSQHGLFNSWSSITSPPSGITRILGVNGELDSRTGVILMTEIWVETQNGQVFSAPFCVDYQKCDPPQWKSRSKSPNPNDYFTNTRGPDCKTLGDLPLSPSGQTIECVYVNWPNGDLPTEAYYALLADGSIKYFVMNFSMQVRFFLKFIFITGLLYFVMFSFVYALTKYVVRRIQINKANISSQA